MSIEKDGGVDWSPLPAPVPGLRCAIVLPARNEALLIAQALKALARQSDAPCLYEVIVLANNCSDDTARQARNVAAGCTRCAIHVVEVSWPAALANVGRARRALLDEAARRVDSTRPADGLIISTDGDTRVAPDWLLHNVAALDAGADAVGGRIVTDADQSLPPAAEQLMALDDTYQRLRARLESLVDPDPCDPWPHHHQHFGASLALTAKAYRAVRHQPLVPFLEDVALVRALRLEDLSVRHCPRVRVHTSARLDGRAEVGLSWQLRQWADGQGVCPEVPDPDAELTTWTQRQQARKAWTQCQQRDKPAAGVAKSCAALLHVDAAWLKAHLTQASTFGRFWDTLQAEQRTPEPPTLPMDEAVRKLRRLIRAKRRPAAHASTPAPLPASASASSVAGS